MSKHHEAADGLLSCLRNDDTFPKEDDRLPGDGWSSFLRWQALALENLKGSMTAVGTSFDNDFLSKIAQTTQLSRSPVGPEALRPAALKSSDASKGRHLDR